MSLPPPPWSHVLRLAELTRGTRSLSLEADETERRVIAKALDLPAIDRLSAGLTLTPWFDGVEIAGHIDAVVTYVCGVSLDPFEAPVVDDFLVRVVPDGSPNATPAPSAELDPEADDPPDEAIGESVDLAAYVVEHLALALDPFPRKPGVAFEPPEGGAPESPFAVLRALKTPPPEG